VRGCSTGAGRTWWGARCIGRLTSGQTLQQIGRSRVPALLLGGAHGGQAHLLGDIEIAEADDGELLRDLDPLRSRQGAADSAARLGRFWMLDRRRVGVSRFRQGYGVPHMHEELPVLIL
jgi:hypothetical protein